MKDKFYYKDGTTSSEHDRSKALHRTDGPAIEYADGDKIWYVDGKLHRTGGPAVEQANGRRSWYVDGKLHRTDGPAVEHTNGKRSWYVYGKELKTLTKKSLIIHMKANNLTPAHLLTDPDDMLRESAEKYKWS